MSSSQEGLSYRSASARAVSEKVGGVTQPLKQSRPNQDSTESALVCCSPGGPTRSGMTPDDAPDEVQASWLDPAIMGPPVVEDVIIGSVLPEFLALVPVPEFHLVFLDPGRGGHRAAGTRA
ncbi:MAG TPA: hypothetical protein VFV73_38925 [Streptosporangiaceae bacterium]|nr:hypothetical protein [Streptosporangiaceae bacterium]